MEITEVKKYLAKRPYFYCLSIIKARQQFLHTTNYCPFFTYSYVEKCKLKPYHWCPWSLFLVIQTLFIVGLWWKPQFTEDVSLHTVTHYLSKYLLFLVTHISLVWSVSYLDHIIREPVSHQVNKIGNVSYNSNLKINSQQHAVFTSFQ